MEDVKTRIRERPSDASFAWVCGAIGARARVDSWMVAVGGSACAIHAVDVVDAGGVRHPLVLKRFFREDWLAKEPDVAAREAHHLQLLETAELPLPPVPRLVAVDPSGEACDVPAVLMTRLPGRAELLPEDTEAWLRSLAEPLASLHALPESVWAGLSPYRSYADVEHLEVPSWTKRRGP